jgi:hypothetical protein
MFVLEKKKSIAYLQAPALAACDFLVHAFCTRLGALRRRSTAALT